MTTGWTLCWLIWMVALAWLAFDGVIFLVVQAGLAAAMSTAANALSYWLGERARTLVRSMTVWLPFNTTLLIGSASILAYGKHLGFAHTYIDLDTQAPFDGLSQVAFLVSFFTLNFAVVNWPTRRPAPPPLVRN
ncbi:MAG: hypothetical protein M3O31_14500 [Acidobacteriota bacterium]|nr:hypothetical protein [Acidobacteriota bacterium]